MRLLVFEFLLNTCRLSSERVVLVLVSETVLVVFVCLLMSIKTGVVFFEIIDNTNITTSYSELQIYS